MNYHKTPFQHYLLAIILVIAAVLRFYKFTEIPMTNDELSALLRTSHQSIGDLIEQGIRTDGHPPLVQLFLYALVKTFGQSAWIIKLPFALCGLASVYYAYRLGTLVNNRTTGLMLAGFIATHSMFIMYSQLARPYAPGLLVCLLFACSGIRIIKEENTTIRHYFMHGLWLFMAAGIHHFAFLTAIICIIPFFVVKHAKPKLLLVTYMLTALAALIYLPIVIAQLQTGGIGLWLGKPDKYFIVNFFYYLSQYNMIGLCLMTGLTLATLSRFIHIPRRDIYMVVSTSGVFVLVLLIGYFYSVLRNPVLQYSALLFATPFLLAAVFYGMSRWRFRYAYLTLFLMMVSNVWGLVATRSYYQLFYHQGYQAASGIVRQFPHAAILLNGNHPSYFNYYLPSNKTPLHIYSYRCDTMLPAHFIDLLKVISTQHDTLVLAYGMAGNPLYFSLVKTYFPRIVKEESGASFETLVCCKDESAQVKIKSTEVTNTHETFNASHEFGKSSTFEKRSDPNQSTWNIEVTTNISTQAGDPLLVLTFKDKNGQIAWHAASKSQFALPGDSATKVFITLRSADIAPSWTTLEAYVWNRNKENFSATVPTIILSKGNPWLYGLIENIPSSTH